MTAHRALVAAVAGALCVSIACDDGPTAPGGPDGPLSFSSVYSSHNSGIGNARTEVIRDDQRWAAVWAEIYRRHGEVPPRPAIDFSQEMLVLVGIGERPNGCHSVEILELSSGGGRIRVRAEERRGVALCICTAALTQPVHVVRAARTDGSADSRIELRTVSCP